MKPFSRAACAFSLLVASTFVASCAHTQTPPDPSLVPPDVIESLAKTYPLPMPPVVANLNSDKRNNVFYVGEKIEFTFDKPATRYEVRDYRAKVVDKGALTLSSTRLAVKSQPPGWYKLYLFGASDQGQMYGTAIGGTTFVVFRRTPGFPQRAPKDAPGGSHPAQDEPMRGVTGMGPQRLQADADNLEQTIKNLEQDIALAKQFYLPFDPVRKRELLVAFGKGTKNLDGVRKIVTRFQNDVLYWEPRNEPNFGANPRDFVANELKPFYETVKSVNPKLRVLAPGTVEIRGDLLRWNDEFFAAGGGQYLDAYSFHAYGTVAGDVFLGRKSLNTLMELLKKHNLQNIEKWQTEQGYFAPVYKTYHPAHQARWTMVQMMLFEQYGTPKEHNHLWYDRSHGFWGIPAWTINDDGSLNPHAATMRVWSEELLGTNFNRVLDFGSSGNNLYLGSEFRSPDGTKRLLSMMSVGDTKGRVTLSVTGGENLRVVSPWGVEKTVSVRNNRAVIEVPELPIYVRLAPGQKAQIVPINYGTNLARLAGTTLSPSTLSDKVDTAKIANGQWEVGWTKDDEAWRVFNPPLPFTLDIAWPSAQSVSRVVIYALPPWSPQATILDYEIQAQIDGAWKTLARETEPTRTWLVWTPPTRTVIDVFHSDRWVFESKFAPVKTHKLRLVIHKVTNGGGLIPLVDQIKGGQAWNVPIVNLREVQVFGK